MRLRPVLRATGIVALVVVALGALVAVWLQSGAAGRFVLSQIQRIAQSRGIAFRADRIDLSLLTLSFSLHNVEIRSEAAPDLPPVFSASSAAADLRLAPLLRGRIDVQDATLVKPAIHIAYDPSGRSNLPRRQSTPGGSPTEWFIRRLRATDGSFIYEDRSQSLRLDLPSWQLDVDGDDASTRETIVWRTRTPGSVAVDQSRLAVDSAQAELALTDNNRNLQVQRIDVRTGESNASVTGSITGLTGPGPTSVNLTTSGLIHTQTITSLLSLPDIRNASTQFRITTTGSPDALQMTGSLSANDVRVSTLDPARVQVQLALDLPSRLIRVNDVRVDSRSVSLRGEAQLSIRRPAGESRATLRAFDVDLQALGRNAGLSFPIDTRAQGTAEIQWPGLLLSDLRGTVKARLVPGVQNGLHATGNIEARSSRDTLLISTSDLNVEGSGIEGTVTIQRLDALSGELRVDAPQVGVTANRVASLASNVDLSSYDVRGPASAVVTLGGRLRDPELQFTALSPGLSIREVRGLALDVRGNYAKNDVHVDPSSSITWQDQRLVIGGRVGFGDAQTALDLNANTSAASVERIAAGLRQGLPVSGSVTANAQIQGTTQSPQIRVTAQVTNAAAYGETVGTIDVEGHLDSRDLFVDKLEINRDEGRLAGTGQLNFDSEVYTVTFAGQDVRIRNLRLPTSAETIRGVVNIQANGSGTLPDPQLHVELSGTDIAVGTRAIGNVTVTTDIRGNTAEIVATSLSHNTRAQGTIGLSTPYAAQVQLEARDVDLSALPISMTGLTGKLSAVAEASGNLTDLPSSTARATIAPFDLRYNDQPITTREPSVLEYANRRVAIAPVSVALPGSSVNLAGEIPFDETQSGSLRFHATADLASLVDLAKSMQPMTASGSLTIDGEVRGNLKEIEPSGKISLQNAFVTSASLPAPIENLNLDAEIRNGALEILRLDGRVLAGDLQGRGEIPVGLMAANTPIAIRGARDGVARFSADLLNISVADLSRGAVAFDGRIGVHLEATASAPDLRSVTAKVTFPELFVRNGNFLLQQNGTSEASLRNGTLTVDRMQLSGPQSEIQLTGTADLLGTGPIDLLLNGKTDVVLLSLFTTDLRAGGPVEVQVTAGGTLSRPSLGGFVSVDNAELSLAEPRVALENLILRLDLTGDRVNVSQLSGLLNGGIITGEGSATLSRANRSFTLATETNGLYLDFPAGLRTLSNAKINFNGTDTGMLIDGAVDILEGSFTEQLSIERGLFRFIQSAEPIGLEEQSSPILESIRLAVGLETTTPVVVDTNLAQGSLTAALQIRGTAATPGLTGRITIEENSEFTLTERNYVIERGVITFANDVAIEPLLDIVAKTRASSYDITMQIQSEAPDRIETTLTSDPPLPETDILTILATGRTLEEARAAGAEIAKEQALSYLAGTLGGSFASEAGRAIGLSQVRIEPSLIASEAEPTARLTLGKDLTPDLSLVYSMNLRNSSDQIWIGKYDITRRFSTRALRQNDASFRFQFQHDLLFGGTDSAKQGTHRIPRKKVAAVSVAVAGQSPLGEEAIRKRIPIDVGDDYEFFKVRTALDRVRDAYVRQGYDEIRASVDRQETIADVRLTFRINPGPRVDMVFEDWKVSDRTLEAIRRSWQIGAIDSQRVDDARVSIDRELLRRGHPQAVISAAVFAPEPGVKRVVWAVQPGARYDKIGISFEGANQVSHPELRLALTLGRFGVEEIDARPDVAVQLLRDEYFRKGYLDVQIDTPRFTGAADRNGNFVFSIREGSRFTVDSLTFSGNRSFDGDALNKAIALTDAERRDVAQVERMRSAIEGFYRDEGFSDAVIRARRTPNAQRTGLDVNFEIEENQRRVLAEIVVEGNDKTSDHLVRSQIGLNPGDTVTSRKLSRARTNLYGTGAFNLVDIEVVPLPNAQVGNDLPVRLVARIRETSPFEIRYGGFYDTERGAGGIADFINRNVLGGARSLGLRLRYDSDLRESRLYFTQPELRRLPLKQVASVFFLREMDQDFTTDRIGVSTNAEWRIQEKDLITLGYRLERTRTYEREPDPLFPFDIRIRVAPLTASYSRDSRDDILDASKGWFTSHAMDWGAGRLGSQLEFLKYFGQYFQYVPLGSPTRVPWANVVRNRLVIAGGARLGVAGGLNGQTLIRSERFLSGGATTVRGFEQNQLGPKDFDGVPSGGNALMVLNSEVRFPLYKFFDGTAFVDAGNVFSSVSDVRFQDLRTAAGLGLRIRTPYVLIRLDWGAKLRRLPGESRDRWFFSIGQAF